MSKAISTLQSLAFSAPPSATFELKYTLSKGFFSSLWGDDPIPKKESFKTMDRFLVRATELLYSSKLKRLDVSAKDKYGQDVFNQTFYK